MLTRWLAFARGILRRQTIAKEVDDELAFHLQQEAERHQARGVPPEEARRLAALSLGGVALTRDEVADVRTTWIDVAWRETRLGIRTLAAAPTFTVPAVIVLALGIGGTTAVFSVLDGVLLQPLPFTHPESLVRVWSRNDERRIAFLSVSPADFEDWQSRATIQLAAYERPRVVQLRDDPTDPVTVMRVSPGLLPLLGVSPALGRAFTPEDGAAAVALVSHDVWQHRFGGTMGVIGRSVVVEKQPRTIVGVMPRGFEVPTTRADLWVPLATNREATVRFAHTLRVIGRARAAADATAVQRDLDVVAAQLAEERPAENRGWRVTVLPLFDTVVSPELRRSLSIVATAVLFVLLLASTTVAGLLLARSTSRQRELAVRTALGASRGSLVRLLLLECVVLAAVSGAVGLVVAFWGVTLLREAGGTTVPRLEEVVLSPRVFACAAAATVLSAILAGVLPAWRSTRSLHESLRTRGVASTSDSGRTLPLLVVFEVSCAVLLVVGASLLVQTVRNLQSRHLGFDATRLLTVATIWPQTVSPAQLVASVEAALAGYRRCRAWPLLPPAAPCHSRGRTAATPSRSREKRRQTDPCLIPTFESCHPPTSRRWMCRSSRAEGFSSRRTAPVEWSSSVIRPRLASGQAAAPSADA